MKLTLIILFVNNRVDLILAVRDSLKKNVLAKKLKLYIFLILRKKNINLNL